MATSYFARMASARERWSAVALLALALGAITCGGEPGSPPVTSGDALLLRCPTAEEVAAIDRDLTITFEVDPTANRTVCSVVQSSRDLTLLQAQAYRTLTIARLLTFDAPLPWTAKPLYPWLVSAIHGIRFRGDTDVSFCCDPANTIDIQAQGLSALQFPTSFRWVGTLLVLLVHEARHNEGFPHTCDTSDDTIAQLGAWGVQYHLDVFLGSHSDPAFISASARRAFLDDAQQTCASRFCHDHC